MPKIKYVARKFKAESLAQIAQANTIIADFVSKGFKLTLRQLFYQLVHRNWIANTQRNYKCLGSVINDGRMAGLIDWDAIEDRTRAIVQNSHWETPADILNSCANSFRLDKWDNQEVRPEVWIEKEALSGIVEGVCRRLDIPFLACRGYTSQSEMWSSAMRLKDFEEAGQKPFIIHLGDHDPSGIDMSRDIQDRMATFGVNIEFERIALNMDQVEQFNPPPNPAKTTDGRFEAYEAQYGDQSWELDALDPETLTELIETKVLSVRDEEKWELKVAEEAEHRRSLKVASNKWDNLSEYIQKKWPKVD